MIKSKLWLYIQGNGITYAKFAELVDFSKGYVADVALNRIKPGRKFIKKVIEVTNGEITEQDLKGEKK